MDEIRFLAQDIIVYEIDDWAVVEDWRTGSRLYEGHTGHSLLNALMKILRIKSVYLDDDLTIQEAEETGGIDKAIERWKVENAKRS